MDFDLEASSYKDTGRLQLYMTSCYGMEVKFIHLTIDQNITHEGYGKHFSISFTFVNIDFITELQELVLTTDCLLLISM